MIDIQNNARRREGKPVMGLCSLGLAFPPNARRPGSVIAGVHFVPRSVPAIAIYLECNHANGTE